MSAASPKSCSSWRRLSAYAGAALGLSSCAVFGTTNSVTTSGAEPFETCPVLQAEAEKRVEELTPWVGQLLETTPANRIPVAVDLSRRPERNGGPGAISSRDGIELYVVDPELISGIVTHEIAHMLMRHQESDWNTLPIVLEEGLCYLLEYGMNGYERVTFRGSLPDPVAEELVTMSLTEFNAQEDDASLSAVFMSMYLSASLGLAGLQELALEAERAGHATIPADAILEALRLAEDHRGIDASATDDAWSVDPLFGAVAHGVERNESLQIRLDFPTDE